MDSFSIENDGRIVSFSMKDRLSDEENVMNSSVLTIREGSGKLMVIGNSKEKVPIMISAHGNMDCMDGECSIQDQPYSNPSNASLVALQGAKKVLNNYILSFEDVKFSKIGKPLMYKNVKELKVGQVEDQFGIMINSEVGIDAERFLVDPLVVKEINVDGKDLFIKLTGATCGVAGRENGFDKSKTVLCSKNALKGDAEEMKAYISVHREQIDTVRRMKLNWHSTRKINLKFDHSPSCYLKGSSMCCKYGTGEDEELHCY